MAPEHGTTHRLHPASLPLELVRRIGRFGFLALVALFLAARSEEVAFLFILLLPIVGAVLRYATFRYELASDRLVVREGLFVKQVRQIPYARIQNLDTTENVLHRALGVVEVTVQTASGKEPEAVFQVISRARLEELRAAVTEGRTHAAPATNAWGSDAEVAPAPGSAPAHVAPTIARGASALDAGAKDSAPATPVFRMSAADLAVYGLSSQKGLVLVLSALFLLREFGDGERLVEVVERGVNELAIDPASIGPWAWVAIGVGAFVVLQLATLAWAAFALGGFVLERRGDALHSQYGLLTRHAVTLPRRRIQALHVQQGLFQRLFRRFSVHAVSAGGVGGEDKEHARPWLVPVCREERLPRVLDEVQPDVDFDAVAWKPIHPGARRRIAIVGTLKWAFVLGAAAAALWLANDVAPALAFGAAGALALVLGVVRAGFVFRALGWARTGKALYLKRGVLTRRRSCVRYEKIQSVRVTQSPLDRLAHHAHVAIDTAGPGGVHASFVVPYLGVRDARRLARELAREANRSDFRW